MWTLNFLKLAKQMDTPRRVNWKGITLKKLIYPLIPQEEKSTWKMHKIYALTTDSNDKNISPKMQPAKLEFNKKLKEVFDLSNGTITGNLQAACQECATLLQNIMNRLNKGLFNERREQKENTQNSFQEAWNQFVVPNLSTPIDLNKLQHFVTNRFYRSQNQQLQQSYDTMKAAFLRFQNKMEQISGHWLAQNINEFISANKEHKNSRERTFSNNKEIFEGIILPHVTNRYANDEQGLTKFINDMNPWVSQGKNRYWKMENRLLLRNAIQQKPHLTNTGEPSSAFQQLIDHLNEGDMFDNKRPEEWISTENQKLQQTASNWTFNYLTKLS